MSGSFTSLEQLVTHFEDPSGNPTAVNAHPAPGSSAASGLFQFVDSTWQRFLIAIGGSVAQYPTAASAPVAVQEAVFQQAVQTSGLSSWTCPGCDPALTSYVNANPSVVSSLPILGGSGVPGSTSGVGATTPVTPSLGGTGASGGTPSEATASGAAAQDQGCGPWYFPTTWFCALGGFLGSIAARAGLLILAVVFILGAMVLFGLKSGIGIEESQGSG